MRQSLVFIVSTFLSLNAAPVLAGNYEIAPASTPFKTDANTKLLKEYSLAMEKLSQSAEQGLVFISVSKTSKAQSFIDPFEYFFGNQNPGHTPIPKRQEGFGSGFFVDLDKGYILTNNHVVEDSDKITLKLANGKSYEGKIVGTDKDTDVAVVQVVDPKFSRDNLAALVLDDSDSLAIGSQVLALGAPFLLEASVTSGIVSAVGRGSMRLTTMGNFIQTDAAINPGNSGGPLINMDGKVVGINSAIYSQSGAYAGIGFAIPSNIARRIGTSLINKGSYYKGYVGIAYEPLRDEWITSLDLPKGTRGIIVAEVLPGGPAHKADIEPGDVVIAVDGKPFEPDYLTSLIGLKDPGTTMAFTLYRQGKKMDKVVTIGTAPSPSSRPPSMASKPGQKKGAPATPDYSRFGFALAPIDDKLRSQFGITAKTGVAIVYIEPMSDAWRLGFREGDVIVSVNGKKLTSVNDFEVATQGKKEVLLQVDRKGRSSFVPLKSESK